MGIATATPPTLTLPRKGGGDNPDGLPPTPSWTPVVVFPQERLNGSDATQ